MNFGQDWEMKVFVTDTEILHLGLTIAIKENMFH